MMNKRIFATVLAGIFAVSVLSGCGTGSGEPVRVRVGQDREESADDSADSSDEESPETGSPEAAAPAADEASDRAADAPSDAVAVTESSVKAANELFYAIGLMAHYELNYDVEDGSLPDEFWQKLSYALFANARYGTFSYLSDDFGTTTWDNDMVARAGALVTGTKLSCDAFPDGLDVMEATSPSYEPLQDRDLVVTTMDDGTALVEYDIYWECCSLTDLPGIMEVKAVVSANPDSPLDGFSIRSLACRSITPPVHNLVETDGYIASLDDEMKENALADLEKTAVGVNYTADGEDLYQRYHGLGAESSEVDLNLDGVPELAVRNGTSGTDLLLCTDRGVEMIEAEITASMGVHFLTSGNVLIYNCAYQGREGMHLCYLAQDKSLKTEACLFHEFYDGEEESFSIFIPEAGEMSEPISLNASRFEGLLGYLKAMPENTTEWTGLFNDD